MLPRVLTRLSAYAHTESVHTYTVDESRNYVICLMTAYNMFRPNKAIIRYKDMKYIHEIKYNKVPNQMRSHSLHVE
jgi:hypothetical protein